MHPIGWARAAWQSERLVTIFQAPRMGTFLGGHSSTALTLLPYCVLNVRASRT